ncbi:MAG: low temperature requirement protein A [Brachybacterium tyrofermentans]|uniref:low temperature requirement protein A n=1 Tax=Brachybacterium tyrofermentans TaxID=47848 RepID=UPI003FB87D69
MPLRARDPQEPGRAASTLELFFDLVFVIAVSTAGVQLHHALSAGDVTAGVTDYLMVFFAIWWAWMNFTWFATAFDSDDWLYRVLTFVQMAGVLVLAAGIGSAFEDADFRLVVIAYVVMRLAMVAQWVRASFAEGMRRTALTYAAGIGLVQAAWLLALAVPDGLWPVVMGVLVLAELSVPLIAERGVSTPWHPHHITERYGCFTLIVLGESLLASANAVFAALGHVQDLRPLFALAALTLIVTAALWWIYFWPPHHTAIRSLRGSLVYGYGHFFLLAAAGAFSAGISAEIDVVLGVSALSPTLVSFAYTIPIAIFVLGIWALALRRHGDAWVNTAVPIGALLVLVDPLIPMPFAITAVVMIAVVVLLVRHHPLPVDEPSDAADDGGASAQTAEG